MKMWTTISVVVAVLTMGALKYVLPDIAMAQDKNIEQMLTTAKTPADHQAIADFYRAEGARLQREAERHAGLAQKAQSEAGGQMPWASHHYQWAEHCRKLADSLGQAAQEAQALAKIHESMAQPAAEKKQ
ncbi:MAG: hypothetical protein AB7G75_24370 [Candidatus Binatia bacterium]